MLVSWTFGLVAEWSVSQIMVRFVLHSDLKYLNLEEKQNEDDIKKLSAIKCFLSGANILKKKKKKNEMSNSEKFA